MVSRTCTSSLSLRSQTPATVFTVHTPVLLFPGHRRRSPHTKHLVHWLTCRNIVAREPALTIKRAGIFMLTPVRIFRWVYIDSPGHKHSFLGYGLLLYNDVASSIAYSRQDCCAILHQSPGFLVIKKGVLFSLLKAIMPVSLHITGEFFDRTNTRYVRPEVA